MIYVVESAFGEFRTSDREEARAWNRENVGSSMYIEEA